MAWINVQAQKSASVRRGSDRQNASLAAVYRSTGQGPSQGRATAFGRLNWRSL